MAVNLNTSVFYWTILALIMYVSICEGDANLAAGDYCMTSDNRPGTCIELTNCGPMAALAMNGGNPMTNDIREKLKQDHCGFNGTQPKVCCPPIILESIGQRFDPDTTFTETDFRIPYVLAHPNFNLLSKNCGEMAEDRGLSNSLDMHQYPWKALIDYNTQNDQKKFGCGGTIISERYILTAAHCLTNLSDGMYVTRVRVGDFNLQTETDCQSFFKITDCLPKYMEYLIEESFVHADYDPMTRQNDIGLIRLASKITFSDALGPICLPILNNSSELNLEYLENKTAIVSGWGLNLVTDYNSPIYQLAFVPVIYNNYCGLLYRNLPIKISEKNICAGGHGANDSCNSDSGGPLQYPANIISTRLGMVQFGIVSVGPDRCGVAGQPSVYTRVAYYVDWILDCMRP